MKQSLMVDMDDVITHDGFLYIINNYLGTNYKEEDFKNYYMQDVVPDKESFFKYFLTQNMYEHAHLFPHAKEVLKELNDYYDLYIGTSYIIPEIVNASSKIVVDKSNYLQEQLPFISPYKYIFLSNKSLLNCDIKIDDRTTNLINAQRCILFTAYHNIDIPDSELISNNIERANCWDDVKIKLLKK